MDKATNWTEGTLEHEGKLFLEVDDQLGRRLVTEGEKHTENVPSCAMKLEKIKQYHYEWVKPTTQLMWGREPYNVPKDFTFPEYHTYAIEKLGHEYGVRVDGKLITLHEASNMRKFAGVQFANSTYAAQGGWCIHTKQFISEDGVLYPLALERNSVAIPILLRMRVSGRG